MTAAFPLQWPLRRPRNKNPIRSTYNKKSVPPGKSHTETRALSVADAVGRLQFQIDLLKPDHYVLSSNLQLRLDGLPRSGQGEPDDCGVCLFFNLNSELYTLPCDRFDRVADNIAAIAAHIEATRKIERLGIANMAEMFTGFKALQAPKNGHWTIILGINPQLAKSITRPALRAAYVAKAVDCHPDNGGSTEAMAEINAAYAQAKAELGING